MHFELLCALKATGIFLGGIVGVLGVLWGLLMFGDFLEKLHEDWLYNCTKGITTAVAGGVGKAVVVFLIGLWALLIFGGAWVDIYKAICPMAH